MMRASPTCRGTPRRVRHGTASRAGTPGRRTGGSRDGAGGDAVAVCRARRHARRRLAFVVEAGAGGGGDLAGDGNEDVDRDGFWRSSGGSRGDEAAMRAAGRTRDADGFVGRGGGSASSSASAAAWEHLTSTGTTMDLDENDEDVGATRSGGDGSTDFERLDAELLAMWTPSNESVKSRRFKPLYGKRLTSKIKELGDARRLDDVFTLLAVSQIPTTPNGRKITVGAVIGACVKCKELELAYKLLMKLEDVDECGAGAPAYSTLMLGFARDGRLIEALELLSRWEKGRGPKSSKFGVGKRGNIILRGSWKWNKVDVPPFKKRDDMGTEWHPKRTATTRMLFAALDACATNGDVKRTRKFMKRIMNWEGRVQGQKNFNEEEYLWNALVKACARSKDAMMCLNVLPEMNKAGVKPTRVTYNITLSACAKAGRPDWCRALLKRMDREKDVDRRPNEVSYTTLLVAETAAARDIAGGEFKCGLEYISSLWETFLERNINQDGIIVGAFANTFVAHGDIDNALKVLEYGYTRKMYISPSVFYTAMRHLATNGDEEGVRRLAEKLKKQHAGSHIIAECDMYEAEACTAAGNVEGARAAVFRVQNGNEEAAAKVFRDRSSGVLVALFVQEVLQCELAGAEDTIDEDEDEGANDFDVIDDDIILNHNGSLCRWEKPDVWSVTQALDLLDGAWSYDEFDEQGIGASPAPPPRGGWANAVNAGVVEPLLFKNGVSPSEPVVKVLPDMGDCVRRGDIIRRNESVADALERLTEHSVAVVIDDDTGIPVGTFRRADGSVAQDTTVGQVMSTAPERLSVSDTTVGDVAMLCVRDSASLIAIVDEQGCIVGTLRQQDILMPARADSSGGASSPR